MRHQWVLSLAVGAVIAVAPPAWAVKLTNLDKGSYDVNIEEGGKSKMHRIEAGATLERLCSEKGCKVRLVDVPDGVYELEGNETITIEDGLIYYAEAYISKEDPGDAIKDVTKDGKLKGSPPKTTAPDKN